VIAAQHLYEPAAGDFAHWRQAARWLARLHHSFSDVSSVTTTVRKRLILHDAAYYHSWLNRALAFRHDHLLLQIAQWYGQFMRELAALPATLIHGEFYALFWAFEATPTGGQVSLTKSSGRVARSLKC